MREKLRQKPVEILLIHTVAMFKNRLAEDLQQKIQSISPRIHLRDSGEAVFDELKGDLSSQRQMDEWLAETEVIFGCPSPKNLIARAPKLKWIQTPIAGAESFLTPDVVESPVIVTNARGIHGTQVGELAVALMMMLAKRAPYLSRQQRDKRWELFTPGLLRAKTLGIVGLGNIGREVARLVSGFRMRVIALEARQIVKPRYIETVYTPEKLHEMLSQCDYLILTVPLTPETRKMIGEAEFKIMKPTAYLINVARGGVVDEEALIHALRENRIAGAGLDVFTTEPLPVSSPLWDLPNVIVTPHYGGQREDYDVLAVDLFCRNLKRYLSGRELVNLVDKKKGY